MAYQGKRGKRLRREKRDRALTIILGLAGIGLAFVRVLWATFALLVAAVFCADWIANTDPISKLGKKKIRIIQASFLICIVSAGYYPALYEWKVEQATADEGNLIGAGQSFGDGKVRMVPAIEIGDSGTTFFEMPTATPSFAQWFQDAGLKVEQGQKGPLVTTPIRDSEGHMVVNIQWNHWQCFRPYCQEKNSTRDALEVLDSEGHVVLQIRILKDRVQLQGEWWDNEGRGVRMLKSPDPNKPGGFIVMLSRNLRQNDALIKPIFKYPSKENWGQFVTH